MEFKQIYFLVIVSVTLFKFIDSSKKYEHINDCHFYTHESGIYGRDNLTLICAEIDRENSVFPNNSLFHCLHFGTIDYDWPGKINFENCRFSQLKRDIFNKFSYIHTIDLSGLGLEILQSDILSEATKLTTLSVSQNNLTEIPPLFFVNVKNLNHVDISENKISQIDLFAFAGGSEIQSLDLSHNSLTIIREHTFDELINLELLNLSFNPIGDLEIDIFIHLLKLKHLILRRINISYITLGTFSHQQQLASLDLSENALKVLNFKIFYPIQHELRALYINGNQLSNLNGFRNALFPRLTLFDIKNNEFNCTYLEYFMETVNWEKIQLMIDPKLIDPHASSIRGINCKVIETLESSEENSNFHHKSNDDTFIKITLVLIFIIMFIFLIMFIKLNRKRIFDNFFNRCKTNEEQTVAADRLLSN